MGLFDGFFTKSNTTQKTVDLNQQLSSLVTGKSYSLGDSESSSTEISTVDEETSLKIAALYQGITIICDTIASLPVYLYKEQEGFDELLNTDERSLVLTHQANEVLSAFNLKKNILKDLILYGNGYAKIDRKGEKLSIYYLPNSIVTPKKDSSGYYFEVQSYSTDVSGENNAAEVIAFEDMLVLSINNKYNSITGVGLLEYANDVLSLSSEETKYMYGLLANGLSAKAILSVPNAFNRQIKTQLRRDIKEYYSGTNNAGKLMIMEGDVKVLPLTLSPSDMKLIENKNFTISEIARFLNIPKHMLNLDRQQGTYSNITQERLQLLTNTLTPYVIIMEQAFNQKLLDESEIGKYYFKFDTSELMKMTPEDQSNYMINLKREKIVTVEEVRRALGLGGDAATIQQLKEMQEVSEESSSQDKKEQVAKEEQNIKEDNTETESKEEKDSESEDK